jgi:DnaJ homolog subfamily C member 7
VRIIQRFDSLKGDIIMSQPLWVERKDAGNAAFKIGDFDNAVRLYSEALDEQDAEATLFSNRSAAYLKMGKYAEATRDAEAAIARDPTFLKAYTRLHNGLCNLGKFTDASRAMEKGVALIQTTNPLLQEDMVNLRTLQKQSDDAVRALETARQCISENNLKKAELALAESYKSFPECPTLAFAFAEARAPSDPDQVNLTMQRYSRTHDSDPQYLYVRALTTYYKGQDGFPIAQKILRQALEFDPDNSNARILLKKIRTVEQCKENGNTAFKEKRFSDALRHYSEAIDLDGGNRRMNATLRGNRAATHLEMKEYHKALLDCDFAIKNGNDGPKMYARRSRIYEAMDKMEDAVRDLQKAAEGEDSYENELRQLKVRVKRSKRKDYYKILGIEQRGATEDIIKRGYKKGALQWHPDRWAHSTEDEKATAEAKFKEVGEAFAVLSDPKKKHMYDNGQLDDNVEGSGGMGGGFGGGQEDIMQMFNMMFANGGGMGGGMGGMGGGRRGRGGPQGFPPGFSFSFQ